MVRSLWSAATGMKAQQTNVDNISNNIANVNTIGYKTKKAEFKSLLYQTLQTKSTNNAGETKPIPAQVGTGTRVASITSIYTQGHLTPSEDPYSVAIEGDGFFKVTRSDGSIAYTRDGAFAISPEEDGNYLVDAEGNYVLDQNNNKIQIPTEALVRETAISDDGEIFIKMADGEEQRLVRLNAAGEVDYEVKIGRVQFNNPSGLDSLGNNLLAETVASGAPMEEEFTQGLTKSKVHQYYIETSNVQVVDEIVNLIVAQRAYEMNSKMITTTDEMMQQANNLR